MIVIVAVMVQGIVELSLVVIVEMVTVVVIVVQRVQGRLVGRDIALLTLGTM